jgi:hypothetical protein
MKIILTIILMNGYSHSYEYKVDNIDPRLCDTLFNKYTYVHTSRFSTAKNKTGIYYKSKEVFAYTCNYKTI